MLQYEKEPDAPAISGEENGMKRIGRLLLFLAALALFCGGCGGARSYTLDELLPPETDEKTLLPTYSAVIVTRVADGASVTLDGIESENLMLCFEHIVTTREKAHGAAGTYTVSFAMTDPDAPSPTLVIDRVHNHAATAFEIGEYRYVTINMTADVTYLESLFADK